MAWVIGPVWQLVAQPPPVLGAAGEWGAGPFAPPVFELVEGRAGWGRWAAVAGLGAALLAAIALGVAR